MTDNASDPSEDTTDTRPTGSEDPSPDRRSRTRRGRRGGRGRGRAPADGVDGGAASSAPAADDTTSPSEQEGPSRPRRRGRRGRGRGKTAAAEPTSPGSADETAHLPKAGDAGGRARRTQPGEDASEGPSGDGSPGTEAPGAAVDEPEGDDTTGSDDAGSSTRSGSRRSRSGSGSGSGSESRSASGSGSSRGGPARAAKGRSGSSRSGGDDGGTADRGGRTADEQVEEAIAKGGTRMAAKKGNRKGGGNAGNRRGQQRPGGVPEEVRRAILEGPPRTMLVSAREDRTQIAVLEDRTVVEHYVTRKEDVTYVGNIYMARVQNVLPGMEAAFLDIGKGRNGVLYAGEVLYDELDLEEGADERIENVLKPGQKVLVQVTKDPMGSKGPRLTMHLSLAGRYVVLAPNSELFGISRKLTDKERDRLRRIVKKVKPEEHGVIVRTAAEGATEEQLIADMQRLLVKWEKVEKAADGAKALTTVYEEPPLVVKVIRDNFGPEFERCTVDDEDLYQQVRGYLGEVAEELLPKVELYGAPTADARARAAGAPALAVEVTEDPAATDASNASDDPGDADASDDGSGSEDVTPESVTDDGTDGTSGTEDGEADVDPEVADPAEDADAPSASGSDPATRDGSVDLAAAAARREQLPKLFEAYDVTDQLRKAMGKKVWLPSGGYLIIEATEAMKVIDVNTGKFTGGKDTNLEEVVLKTNLEAADEIVRQLRLRDIGGIIVIDFIDMLLKANQDQVVRRLKRELLRDRTKTRVSEVSRLGLVQMTRKNVSQGLVESFSHSCEACEGRGLIPELD